MKTLTVADTKFTMERGKVIASFGPVVVAFTPTNAGLTYDEVTSNVKLEWQHMPAVALAAARWYRANK